MVYYGLATRAGKIVYGADSVREQILKKKIYMIIIAEDASLNTKDKFLKLAKENGIESFVFGDISENSKAIGRKNKAIIGVADKNFSDAIAKIIIGGGAIGQENT